MLKMKNKEKYSRRIPCVCLVLLLSLVLPFLTFVKEVAAEELMWLTHQVPLFTWDPLWDVPGNGWMLGTWIHVPDGTAQSIDIRDGTVLRTYPRLSSMPAVEETHPGVPLEFRAWRLNFPLAHNMQGEIAFGPTLDTIYLNQWFNIGTNIDLDLEIREGVPSFTMWGNGVPYHSGPVKNNRLEIWFFHRTLLHFEPEIVSHPDLTKLVGDPYIAAEGILARWGWTTERFIPGDGEITYRDFSTNYNTDFSTDGVQYDLIGMADEFLVVRDLHSLSAEYPHDDTSTTISRHVTVSTSSAPTLISVFNSGAVDTTGAPIPIATLYDPNSSITASGGEDGWTNQPLDITCHPGAISGTFMTGLTIPFNPRIDVANAPAIRNMYHGESTSTAGTPIWGVLTGLMDTTNELSSRAYNTVKIDTTDPMADASYVGGFVFIDTSIDSLSGLSTALYPTQIAFTSPSDGMTPPTSGWEDIASHTHNTSGNYDVWVWATDKAGNEHKVKAYASLYMGGEVHITKDTDLGAVLHESTCLNFEHLTIEPGCGVGCNLGATPHIVEQSTLNYNLTLSNLASVGDADGTFVDYLPEGMVISTMPIVTPVGSATVTYALETLPPYAGRYKVSGSYTGLAPGGQIVIDIASEVPLFDSVTPANNILVNQASTDWSINSGMLTGTNESNYAVHQVVLPGVDTLFTKVGADAPSVGIPGVEFTLYRWDGALAPTTAEQNHIVDTTVLIDNSLPGGDWVRVKYDGEDATSLTDIFVSETSPLGEVDLGNLPEGVYSLIETKAPSGYELPVGQWILTVDPSKNDTGASDWKLEFVGKSTSMMPPAVSRTTGGPQPTYQVINIRPFSIGISGLGGTKGLLLSGFVIMAIAGNVYLRSSDKGRKTKGANNE